MTTLSELWATVLGLLLFAIALSVPALLRVFRRVITVEAPSPIGRMMKRWGLSPESAAGREYDLAMAASRCGSCKSTDRCRAWLAAGGREGAEAFCPNAPFLRELKKL